MTIVEGDHCGYSDEDGPGLSSCENAEYYYKHCYFGFPLPSNHQGATVGSAVQTGLALDYITPWLEFYLKDKSEQWQTFITALSNSAVEYESGTQ